MLFVYSHVLMAVLAYGLTKSLLKSNKIPLPVRNHLRYYLSEILKLYIWVLLLTISLKLLLQAKQSIVFSLEFAGSFTIFLESAAVVLVLLFYQFISYIVLTRKVS